MPRNTSVTLGEYYGAFVQELVESGEYASSSEVIRAGLRQLKERKSRLEELRDALIEGENSGYADYSLAKIMAETDV